MCRKIEYLESKMSSVEEASRYVRGMVEAETQGWGDDFNALSRLGNRYSLSRWTLNHLRTGRAKTVEASLFSRIRAAYLDTCERQIAKLQHQLAIEKAMGATDDDLGDLEREASNLAARLKAKREASR